MQPLWDERYQPADAEIVKKKAARMAKRRGFDVEDLAQELAMHVYQQTPKHDPARGRRDKFVGKVAKNRLLNLIESRRAQKRDDRRNIEYEDGPEGALIDGEVSQDQIDLSLDMQAAVARMPPDVRAAFEFRMAGHSETELQKLMGRTRAQIRTLLQRLERILKDAGLGPDSEE